MFIYPVVFFFGMMFQGVTSPNVPMQRPAVHSDVNDLGGGWHRGLDGNLEYKADK